MIFFSATVNSLSVRISHPVCHRFSFSLAFSLAARPIFLPSACRQGPLEVINIKAAILGPVTWITFIRRFFSPRV